MAQPRIPVELAATVLALTGVRRGDVVIDLVPAAWLSAGAVAGAGPTGHVMALVPASAVPAGLAPMLPGGVHRVTSLAEIEPGTVMRALAVDPTAAARTLAPLLVALRPLLAPGARVTVAAAPNTGSLAEGLPAVLAACGLIVLHAEGLSVPELPAGRVALAVGRPAAPARPAKGEESEESEGSEEAAWDDAVGHGSDGSGAPAP